MAGAMALARDIVAEHGGAVRAVLFYGSCRRTGDASGLLDLYVVHDGQRAFHRRWLPALLNAALPPNVMQRVGRAEGVGEVRAKVAVLSRRQFERRLRPGTLDTTIWARFCQPTTLLYARDAEAAAWAATAGARAFATAALWAARLGPRSAAPAGFWQALFAKTYGAELRTERQGAATASMRRRRGGSTATCRWLSPRRGWTPPRMPRAADAGAGALLAPQGRLGPAALAGQAAERGAAGQGRLHLEGGADYLAWKIERHSGEALALTDWQRRHPILAAPRLLWRLLRRGAVR
ncbi:hypothetical protein ACFQU7_25860 [Pseudoroseomonas wenyumeiae]